MEKFKKSMIGKKVRATDKNAHEENPDYYPAVGTIGTIVTVTDIWNEEDWAICWPEGSVRSDGVALNTWFCDEEYLELVEEKTEHMTDEDIFYMLMPKFEKNYTDIHWISYWADRNNWSPAQSLIKAIALAYRSGYGRGKKGRPFKIGGDKSC